MFKNLTLGLKKGVAKMSGTKLTEDEEFTKLYEKYEASVEYLESQKKKVMSNRAALSFLSKDIFQLPQRFFVGGGNDDGFQKQVQFLAKKIGTFSGVVEKNCLKPMERQTEKLSGIKDKVYLRSKMQLSYDKQKKSVDKLQRKKEKMEESEGDGKVSEQDINEVVGKLNNAMNKLKSCEDEYVLINERTKSDLVELIEDNNVFVSDMKHELYDAMKDCSSNILEAAQSLDTFCQSLKVGSVSGVQVPRGTTTRTTTFSSSSTSSTSRIKETIRRPVVTHKGSYLDGPSMVPKVSSSSPPSVPKRSFNTKKKAPPPMVPQRPSGGGLYSSVRTSSTRERKGIGMFGMVKKSGNHHNKPQPPSRPSRSTRNNNNNNNGDNNDDDDDDGCPPPPPPSINEVKISKAKPSKKGKNGGGGGNRSALFADINKGRNGGFKLRKVKKSEMKRPKSPKSMEKEKQRGGGFGGGGRGRGGGGFGGGGLISEMMAKRKNMRH